MRVLPLARFVVVSTCPDLTYRGPGRLAWPTLDDRLREGNLPAPTMAAFRAVDAAARSSMWLPRTTHVMDDARHLYEFLRAEQIDVELLAVSSPYLRRTLGGDDRFMARAHHEWLGYDVIEVGEWSLVRELEDSRVSVPLELETYQNRYGLFRSDSVSDRLRTFYDQQAELNNVEPLGPLAEAKHEAVSVWRQIV